MKKVPIVDLHCDLLSFLVHKPGRTTQDSASRTSHPLLKEGNVHLQTLAIFSTTGNRSVAQGQKQVDHLQKILSENPLSFACYSKDLPQKEGLISILPAFENASTFSLETEPLSESLKRLEGYLNTLGKVFYISLTWNEENRFGGGNMTTAGLKEDGKRLLEWLSGKNIAVDLSHTSDKLAYEMIDFIDQNGLKIPLIASHSNFRAITKQPRNLPEDLAKEIIRRKGLIGLNFFAAFIHPTDPLAILRHVEYGLSLGGEDALCFGADFFCETDFPSLLTKYERETAFYPEFSNSSSYPNLITLLSQKLGLKEEQLSKIGSQNALRFLA